MAWRRFAAAGLVPGSLVGWELFAYGKQRQKFDDAKKVRPKPLVEGSTAWLIERDARTLDLVCVRHKALDRGPAAALADAAARVDEAYPYDGVGVVVVDCVEINQCVGCPRQFFTKSFRGDDAADLARSSGEEPASPRHRAGVASMAWRTTR